MDGIYDIRNIVAIQLNKLSINLPLDPLFDIIISSEGINISIITTGGYIQYTKQELLDGLQALMDEVVAEENFKEVGKGPLCVITCGEHGYFKIWGNWPSYDPPTFTTNLEEAFVYDNDPSMTMNTLQDIRDTLERHGYEAIIIEKEDCKE